MIQDLSYKISCKLKSIIRNFGWFDINFNTDKTTTNYERFLKGVSRTIVIAQKYRSLSVYDTLSPGVNAAHAKLICLKRWNRTYLGYAYHSSSHHHHS